MEDLGMMEVREVQLGMMQDENYAGWGGGKWRENQGFKGAYGCKYFHMTVMVSLQILLR